MLKRVMENQSAIPVLEDEAIQFECLLVEPQADHISVDAFLCFHRNSPEKCMKMEDVPCKFGGLKFGAGQNQEHLLGREVFDIKPSKIEAGKFQESSGPSSTEDYLLDVECGENGIKLDDSSIGLQKLVSENHNQANQVGDYGTPEKSDSSGTADRASNCQADLEMSDFMSHDIFRCTADRGMSLEESWFKYSTFSTQNMQEDVSSMFSERNNETMSFAPGLPSEELLCTLAIKQENEQTSIDAEENEESFIGEDVSPSKNHIQASSISTPAEKRLRKRPQRFIDEQSEPKLKSSRKRKEVSAPTSKGKLHQLNYPKQCDAKSRERLFSEECAGIAIQVPFGPIIQKEHRTNQVSVVAKVLQPDKEASMSESEDDDIAEVKLVEDGGRRKHHILWTVSEVRKLIDGVSQYGVGRWSRIKKDYFSSSAHRTPVDLKDKWRNLLKASCAQRESTKGDDRKRNLAWRPLPKSILRRVSDLATIYPYPRDLRSKH